MTILPFVVQPKHKPIIEYIGSEESGQIAIERRGYLSSGEKAFVQQALGADEASMHMLGLSRKISNDKQVSMEEAYNLVVQVLMGESSDDVKELSIQYADEVNDLVSNLSTVQSKEAMLRALCLVQYRINDKCTVNDVMKLHPDIINGLSELYVQEEAKSIERLVASQESDMVQANENESISEVEKLEKKSENKRRASIQS